MSIVTLELPDDVLASLHRSPEEFASEMRVAAALLWYSRGELSMGKAAQVAGLSLSAFLDTLSDRKMDVFSVDVDALREELKCT